MKKIISLSLFLFAFSFAAHAHPDPYFCLPGMKQCPDGGCVPENLACVKSERFATRICGGPNEKGERLACSYGGMCDDPGTCMDSRGPRVCDDGRHCAPGFACTKEKKCYKSTSDCITYSFVYGWEVDHIKDSPPKTAADLVKLSTMYKQAYIACMEDPVHNQAVIQFMDNSYYEARHAFDVAYGPDRTKLNETPQACKKPDPKNAWCVQGRYPGGQKKSCIGVPVRNDQGQYSVLTRPSCGDQTYFAVVASYNEAGQCYQSVVKVGPKEFLFKFGPNYTFETIDSSTVRPRPVVLDAYLATDGTHTADQVQECLEANAEYQPCLCQ